MQTKHSRWYEYVLKVTDGMTATEAAAVAGFDKSAMSRWKDGRNAEPRFVVQFARAFNQNVLMALAEAELITDEEASLHEVKIGVADMSTQGLLEELARRIDRKPADPDPDYSQMSDQDAKDYDLAAFKGEDNIAHDDLPNEP